MSEQKVVGGEFKIAPDIMKSEYYNDLSPCYSLGRTCLYSILNSLTGQIESLFVPDYLCYSIVEVPKRLNIPFKHYHITPSFTPDIDNLKELLGSTSDKTGILLISYFGLIDLDDAVRNLRTDYPNAVIIIDDVQNYYGIGAHSDYDYCFTSLRKWFPVPDGADILQKNNSVNNDFLLSEPNYTSYKVAGNLLKNHNDIIGDDISLELIKFGEEMMDHEYRYKCSDITKNLIRHLDIEHARVKRRENAGYLHEGLDKLGIKHLYDPDSVPLFIPIITDKRDILREKFFKQSIFCPIHWPVIDANLQGENELYFKELSLVCDQRYDKADMERILQVLS